MSLWALQSNSGGTAQRAHSSHAFRWLLRLGAPGVFCVSVIDSSPVPMPIPGSTDLLLLWLAARNGRPWLLVLCAVAGSLLGGWISWRVGKKGGEELLKRRVPARLLDPIHRWARSNPFLSVFLPALLPPPVPLSPFVLSAGALGIPLPRYLISFGAARSIRYSLIAWLGVSYGRHVIRLWSDTLDRWSTPLLVVFFTLVAAGILFAVIKARRRKSHPEPKRSVRETAAD